MAALWDVAPRCSLVETDRRPEVLTASIFRAMVNLYETSRRNNQAVIFIILALRTWNLAQGKITLETKVCIWVHWTQNNSELEQRHSKCRREDGKECVWAGAV
jgi:hypothetical protein